MKRVQEDMICTVTLNQTATPACEITPGIAKPSPEYPATPPDLLCAMLP